MTELDPRLQRYLQQLPAAAPPTATGERVLQRYRRRRRQRHLVRAAVAFVAVAVLGLGAWPALQPQREQTIAERTAPVALPFADVRALDRELQLGLARGDDPQRLQSLWLTRQAAVQGLDERRDGAVRLVRL